MGVLRYVRVLPIVGVVVLVLVSIVAIVIRFGFSELEPTMSHTEQVQLGRPVFMTPQCAELWGACATFGIIGMLMMLVAPFLRFLPE